MDFNRVICGDSFEVLKTFPDNVVDLIVTSPPYWGCRVYGEEKLGRESHPLDYVKSLAELAKELMRVLKPSGSMYLNIGDVYFGTKGFSRNTGKWQRKTDSQYKEHIIANPDGKYLQHKQLLLLPLRVAIAMQEDGWILRNDIIWEKPNPLPTHSPDRRLPVHEHIFHFAKSKKYYFNYTLAKELQNHRSVFRCGIEAYKEHLATFPEKLIEPLVLTTSKEGDVVLDPFFGSGTVGAVCKKHNRQYLGIELVPRFCNIAEQRIGEEKL